MGDPLFITPGKKRKKLANTNKSHTIKHKCKQRVTSQTQDKAILKKIHASEQSNYNWIF